MVIHIALFKWRDDVAESEINGIMEEIEQLKGKIDEIVEIYCGKNFSKWSKGYTHAVIVMVENKEALDAYRNHPLHTPIAKKVEKLEEDSMGIDIEM